MAKQDEVRLRLELIETELRSAKVSLKAGLKAGSLQAINNALAKLAEVKDSIVA